MLQRMHVFGMVVICSLISGARPTFAQDYPNKPVRLITGSVGSNTDLTARLLAQKLAQNLGQQFIVDNRANPAISGGLLAKSAPNGYTLMANASNIWLLPLLQDAPYDPLRDFLPISLTTRSPNVLVVHPSTPAGSVQDVIALAKSKPGELNYASGSTGATPHLAAELFKSMAGINIVRVAYKGGSAAVIAVLSREVFLTFATAGSAAPHLQSGKLRALAVTSAQPSPLFPGLPTVAASGLPGYESMSTNAIFAPTGTPAAIIQRLNHEVVKVLNTADIKEKFFKSSVEAAGSSPEQLTTTMRSESARMAKIIKEAGIRAD